MAAVAPDARLIIEKETLSPCTERAGGADIHAGIADVAPFAVPFWLSRKHVPYGLPDQRGQVPIYFHGCRHQEVPYLRRALVHQYRLLEETFFLAQ